MSMKNKSTKNKLFELYFRENKDVVFRFALDKTGDYQAAQEICQQVFFQLYVNMDKVHPDMIKSWLIRCTRHALIDYFRKAEFRKEMFADNSVAVKGNLLVEESLDLYEEKKKNAELTGRILEEVRAVNEKWYEVLVMSCIDGMSYAEMAEELDMSVDALRARVYRARTYVRERFGDEYQDLFND